MGENKPEPVVPDGDAGVASKGRDDEWNVDQLNDDLDDDDVDDDGDADPRTALAAIVRSILVETGPLSPSALASAVRELGLSGVHPSDLDEVVDSGEVPHVIALKSPEGIGDSVVFAVDILLQDRIFTHLLTAPEIADHAIDAADDLSPLVLLTEATPFDHLTDGSPVESTFIDRAETQVEVLAVSGTALAAFRPDTLMGVGVGTNGLRLVALPSVSDPINPPAGHIARLLTRDGEPRPILLDDLIYLLCLDDSQLFTEPLAPLGQLLVDWGLQSWGAYVGPAGFDFDGWIAGTELHDLTDTYDITQDQASAVLLMSQSFDRAAELAERLERDEPSGEEEPVPVGTAAAELADPAVAEAFFWETVGIGVDEAGVMLALTDVWAAAAPSQVRPALAWLQGKSHERLGDVTAAESSFERSLSLDPFFGAALVDLARYAGDRGDAPRAVALLERAGFTDEDPLLAGLRPYQPVDHTDLGRNDPCWCGSGTKYKRCHLGKAELTEVDHARWLKQKIVMFAHDAPQGAMLIQLAAIRTGDVGVAAGHAIDDPLVIEIALFEGELVAEFAQIRGELLPSAELSLLQRWLTTRRSVLEVVDVTAGRAVALRDRQTQQRHELSDDLEGQPLSRSLHVGDLLLTRLLPVGDVVVTLGFQAPVAAPDLAGVLDIVEQGSNELQEPYGLMASLTDLLRK